MSRRPAAASVDPAFAATLRQLREQAGLSYRELGRLAHYSSGTYVWELEKQRKRPTPATAEHLDKVLSANGRLASLVVAAQGTDDREAARESAQLCRLLAAGQAGDAATHVQTATRALAVEYRAMPKPQMLAEALRLRRTAVDALEQRRITRPGDVADTTAMIGYLSGVLTYAALDLGRPEEAATHAEAAWAAADTVGDAQLRAWVRGTQSLVARFREDFPAALAYAEDGLRHTRTGTAPARLRCGVAQCHANMGTAEQARHHLAAAASAREAMHGEDQLPGLFGFSLAKEHYYTASALIWLPEKDDHVHARAAAETAIRLWRTTEAAERDADDEHLAHVYAATASVHLGDLDATACALDPILSMPAEQRISWIGKRLRRVGRLLREKRYTGSHEAGDLLERISAY